MRLRRISLFAFLALTAAICSAAPPSEQENAALQADTQWLQFIDSGDLQSAWNHAAPMLQSRVEEPAFAKSVENARKPLEALNHRTLLQVQENTSLPGVPDGHYVVAQYSTDFANKAHAVETIIASQATDGSWHVAGYFIR